MPAFCDVCCEAIEDNVNSAIKCTQCSKWFHGKCSFPPMDKDVIEMMKLLNHSWICDECSFGKPPKVAINNHDPSASEYLVKISEMKACIKCMQESSEHLMSRLADSDKLITELNEKVDLCNSNITRLMQQNRKLRSSLRNIGNSSLKSGESSVSESVN